MYHVRIIENHGHNGDEVIVRKFPTYDEAFDYVRDYYFDGDETSMNAAERDVDEWYCYDADAKITIE